MYLWCFFKGRLDSFFIQYRIAFFCCFFLRFLFIRTKSFADFFSYNIYFWLVLCNISLFIFLMFDIFILGDNFMFFLDYFLDHGFVAFDRMFFYIFQFGINMCFDELLGDINPEVDIEISDQRFQGVRKDWIFLSSLHFLFSFADEDNLIELDIFCYFCENLFSD